MTWLHDSSHRKVHVGKNMKQYIVKNIVQSQNKTIEKVDGERVRRQLRVR